ncbi:putative oxidoreductase, aryl-alcohol dehydrogenase like protein [Terriglobus roseus DSM 18391]|uniref:Putative oxidoreductase, aryl-alcohol dehydrogenase like protein n=1 Tax=Terriglobus roseus (strain DSM 18391 / NRRL B-41598 / KBS 63) TaxID=926566 RepID=I3ZMF4_TERRK|nr:aldo/keto reductase family oxidoreductase [Terriglobus roseus]AFL90422.1 putative oxidoreductase, aryl-alcohol dehydrogenase like protein [Terriglobus roseus DSM 18391]
MAAAKLGGTFNFPTANKTVYRVGYGAMRLSGPHIFGPPADRDEAIRVLRTAIEAGVDHIDTSDFYGPFVTNQIIREALSPYPDKLTIVTKIGAKRGETGSWDAALSRQEIIDGVHSNLRNLGLDALDVVNLRLGAPLFPAEMSIEEPLTVLLELQQQGLIRHLGLSTVTEKQIEEGQKLAKIVCVQNLYNIAQREDDALIDTLNAQGIAYVPYFPLGGFSPLQSSALDEVAKGLGATSMQVALAWLLHRSPNILLIPGTSSVAHLKENLAAADLELSAEAVAQLDAIGN